MEKRLVSPSYFQVMAPHVAVVFISCFAILCVMTTHSILVSKMADRIDELKDELSNAQEDLRAAEALRVDPVEP
jgi:hypothetical protein